MRKVIKILFSVLSGLVLAVIILPVLVALLLNVEGIQNFAVRKAGEAISARIGTTVSMDRIRIRGFSRVEAEGFYVEDLAGDTMLYASKLSANISRTAILRRKIIIGDIKYTDGKVYLYTPEDGQMNLQAVLDTFTNRDSEKTGGTDITLRDIRITGTRFKLQREGADTIAVNGMNYGNMIFEDLNIGSHNLRITDNIISMNLYGMSFTDISGLRIDDMSVEEFIIGDGLLDFKNTGIITPDSRLTIPKIILDGKGDWKSFGNYTDRVEMDVSIVNSGVHSHTLAYFIPGLGHDVDLMLDNVSLTFQGPVNDFRGRIYDVTSGRTRLEGRYALRGVSDIATAAFDIDMPVVVTSGAGIASLLYGLTGRQPDEYLANLTGRAGDISATLKVRGMLSEFDTDVDVATALGDVSIIGAVRIPSGGGIGFDGEIGLSELDAGTVSGVAGLGLVTARSRIRGDMGNGKTAVYGNLAIEGVEFNGYDFGPVWANMDYDNGYINGRLISNDDNLRFGIAGSVDIRDSIPEYDVAIDVKKANLHRLGVYERDSTSVLSGRIIVDGSGSGLDNMNGSLKIEDLKYESSTDSVVADSLVIKGRNNEKSKFLSLTSPFADAEFVSEVSYTYIFDYLNRFLYDYLPSLKGGARSGNRVSAPDAADKNVRGVSLLKVNIKKTNNIASIFVPGFSIAEGTKMDAVFNPVTEKFSLSAESDYVEMVDFLITKLKLSADNSSRRDSLQVTFKSEDLYVPGFKLPSSSIVAAALNDGISLKADLSNPGTEMNAHIEASALIGRDSGNGIKVAGTFGPSHLTAGDQVWKLFDSGIAYSAGRLEVSDFRILNNGQGLYANGIISGNRSDTLNVRITELNIAPLSAVTSESGFTLQGIITGYADISALLNQPLIVADVRLDGMMINEQPVVPLVFSSKWDFATERATMRLSGRDDGRDFVRGYYRPTDRAYMAQINVPGIPLSLLGPVLDGAVTGTRGTADVNINVRSVDRRPQITGTAAINRLETTVAFNNVTYTIPEATVSIEKNVASLGPVRMLDSENNGAELTATADFRNFSNIIYSARLIPANLLVLNTGPSDNEAFFGKVYASGALNVTGDRMGLNVNVVATTENNSVFVLPLGGKSSVSQADFIVFESAAQREAEAEDALTGKKMAYERRMRGPEERRVSTVINMTLNVLPNTQVSLMLDSEENNVINARGNASLNLRINPGNDDFNMSGTYEISSGDFVLNIPGILSNRRFTIEQGGRIQWTGDPVDAMLDITAAYRLRASIDPIRTELGIANDNGAVGRIPIDCIVRVSGLLSQPDIRFEVNAPSAPVDIQNRLSILMSTQEMMAQQFIWLMLAGSFMSPDNAITNFNIGSAGTSVGLDFLTSNISNLLSGISDMADFTLRIRPQDEYSSSEVDIGFTTDIIENRLFLEVEGNFNTRDNEAAINQNNVSGDASLTGILNRSGNIRGKLFTRTIDRFDIYQGLQESGIGIYYREDYDKFSDVIERSRARTARRRQQREERREAKSAVKPKDASQETDSPDSAGEEPEGGQEPNKE